MPIVRNGDIKTIGRGTIAIEDAALSNTATIAAVNTAKTLLFHLGAITAINHVAYSNIHLALTNATTITATRGATDGSADVTVSYQYVEYY